LNPASDARIHLVADTTGTSAFWRLVGQGQVDRFEQPNPDARLVPYDPAARPNLLIERFNVAPLMPPAEVEQLAYDLLADLAPADESPGSAAAIGQFVTLIVDFCRDWRSLWSLFGADPAATAHYQRLASFLREQVSQLPTIVVAGASTNAQAVLNARLLAQLFGGAGARREAAEFNVAAAAMPGSQAGAGSAVRSAFTGSLFQVGSLDGVGDSATPTELPVIERPIIILSAPRAGSTLLFETLAQAAGLYTIGGESHRLFDSIDALRPGGGAVNSNRLTGIDARDSVVAELRRRFATELRDRDGAPPPAAANVRLLEKTPKNALRVPFLLQLFPDARFVFLHRDLRANLSSMIQAWRSSGWVTYRNLTGWDGPWSLLLPPNYERLRGRPIEEIVAFQWQAANETILDDLQQVPRDRWTTVRYEDLIGDPKSEVARLLEFAGLSMDPRLVEYLSRPLPHSRHTQTAPHLDKWRQDAAEIDRVLPSLTAVVARLAR
ncbi:MAG: sulfotransferase, partial [Steroidobacteraceae bacterium]